MELKYTQRKASWQRATSDLPLKCMSASTTCWLAGCPRKLLDHLMFSESKESGRRGNALCEYKL